MVNVNAQLKELQAKVADPEKDLEKLKVEKDKIDEDKSSQGEGIKKTAELKYFLEDRLHEANHSIQEVKHNINDG